METARPDVTSTSESLTPSPASESPITPESLHAAHYLNLVRTAALMTDDRGLAEEVVQEAFTQIIARWSTIQPDKALAYLYRAVTNGARSVLRRRRTVRAHLPERQPPGPAADDSLLKTAQYEALLAAVSQLPPRQRQVLVLRYYSELSIADTAEALNIKPAAVTVATQHALKALRKVSEVLT